MVLGCRPNLSLLWEDFEYYDDGDGDTETMTYEEWSKEFFFARVFIAPVGVGFVTVVALIVGSCFGLWP